MIPNLSLLLATVSFAMTALQSDAVRLGDMEFYAENPAIAFNSKDKEYLVVWVGEDDSGNLVEDEREIFGQRVNAITGEEVGVDDFRISQTGLDGSPGPMVSHPSVTYNPVDNEYLVVWSGDMATQPPFGEMEIFGQRLDASTGEAIGEDDFRISVMGLDGDRIRGAFAPEVAYDEINHQYLVVWGGSKDTIPFCMGSEIWGQLLDASTGSEIGHDDFAISGDGSCGIAISPDVTFNPLQGEFLVVWSSQPFAPPVEDREIYGQRLSALTGHEVGPDDFPISSMGPVGSEDLGATWPAVTYNPMDNVYLVVWTGDDVVDRETEVFGQYLDASTGQEIGQDDFQISFLAPGVSSTDASYNGFLRSYLVAWKGADNSQDSSGDKPFVQPIDDATEQFIGHEQSMGEAGIGLFPRLASSDENFYLVWSTANQIFGRPFAPNIQLDTNPENVLEGDEVTFSAFAGRDGGLFALLTVSVNEIPFFLPLLFSNFDRHGAWLNEFTVPPGLSGLEFEFQVLGFGHYNDVQASNIARLSNDPECNMNGIPDAEETDCNANGFLMTATSMMATALTVTRT